MRPIISRSGGKSKLLKVILPLIPKHEIYVEPFIGGGSVFFGKEPSNKEVINDLDKDTYDIYKDMKAVGNKLSNRDFQPNREKFWRLVNQEKFKTAEDRLYRNLYIILNSFKGTKTSYVADKKEKEVAGTNRGRKYKDNSYYDRLQGVKIFNKDYSELIDKYDTTATFFYLDPPYSDVSKNKVYGDELKDFDLEKLLNKIKNIKGKFMLSYDIDSKDRIKKILSDKKYKYKVVKTRYESDGDPFEIKEILVMNY